MAVVHDKRDVPLTVEPSRCSYGERAIELRLGSWMAGGTRYAILTPSDAEQIAKAIKRSQGGTVGQRLK